MFIYIKAALLFLSVVTLMATENIQSPFFKFQKVPSDSGFILTQEISNIITFSEKKRENGVIKSTTYDLCIVKLLPYQKIPLKSGEEISAPLYIPLISPLYKNQWSVFTGIDKLTKNIEFLKLEDVPLLLQYVLYEMTLYVPRSPQKTYTDLSQMYPDRFFKIISGYLSAQKNSQDYKDVSASPRFLFDDVDPIEDKTVDVFRSLASLLPFWISERDLDAILMREKVNQNDLTPFMVATAYLKFSDQSSPLKGQVTDGYSAFNLQKKILRNVSELCVYYYDLIKKKMGFSFDQECDKVMNQFISTILRTTLKTFIREQKNGHYNDSLSFMNLQKFFDATQQKIKTAKNTTADVQEGYSTLLEHLQKEQTFSKEEGEKLQKMLNALKGTHLSKKHIPAVYDLPEDIFSTFVPTMNEKELVDFYNEQVLIEQQKRAINFPISCSCIMFILSYLPVFYKLHNEFLMLSAGFKNYFDTLHPDYASAFEDENQKVFGVQEVNEIIEFYKDFKNIVTVIRKLYPGFGFIPQIKDSIVHKGLPIGRSEDTSERLKNVELPQADVETPEEESKESQSSAAKRVRPPVVLQTKGKSLLKVGGQPKPDATR